MRRDLEKYLVKKFPLCFGDYGKDPKQSCMYFGIEFGTGWYKILKNACEKAEPLIQKWIDEHKNEKDFNMDWCPKFAQLKEKYGCYDEKTEVLTENGWKFFKDITINDKIATLEDRQFLKYYNPTDVISYTYTGKMYYLKTRGVNLLVTPNHNLYVAKGSYYNGWYKPPKRVDREFELVTPEKYFGKNKRFKKNVEWNGIKSEYFELPEFTHFRQLGWKNSSSKDVIRKYVRPLVNIGMEAWLEFLGFYVAEGCSSIKTASVSIAFNNTDGGRERQYLEKLINNIGYNFKTSQSTLRIYDIQLSKWLVENCGHLAENKKVPQFIKQLSPSLIRYFLIGLYNGDGHKTKTANILSTVSKQLSDDVQELIFKTGDSSFCFIRKPRKQKALFDGRIIQGKFDSYEINWLMKSADHNTQNKGLSKRASEAWVDYSGNVYCVTVPNHVIYVRREGIPVWCGNSMRLYFTTYPDGFDEIEREAEKKSETTCEKCGKEGKIRGRGWYYTACYKHSKPEDRENLEIVEDAYEKKEKNNG
jgi:replicative DNA helicase Mcm